VRIVALLVVVGCSSTPVVPDDASIDGTAKKDGASDASLAFDVGDAAVEAACVPQPACPSSLPTANTPCNGNSTTQYVCEYGSAAQSWCNTLAYCSGTLWQIETPFDGGPCTQPAECPTTIDGVDAGAACNSNSACNYQEGTCACLNGTWQCVRPTDPACPAQRPRIGTACTTGSCPYGQYCSLLNGDILACTCGTWQEVEPPPCPP
jgi:hypothetical protein